MTDVDDFLKHYGVLGMKWGVTRSEKALAAASKTRAKSKKTYKRKSKTAPKIKAQASEDYTQARDLQRKKAKSLSNEEMQVLVTRMNLEQNYSRLNPSNLKKGMAATKTTLEVVGVATNVINTAKKAPSLDSLRTEFAKGKARIAADLATVKDKKK